MKLQSSVATNIAWVGVGNGIALVVGFASSILLARWLGPEARGVYALIMTTSIMLAAFFGNNAWIQAFAFLSGKKRYSPPQIAGHGILIALGCTVIVAVPLIVMPDQVLESFFPELRRAHLWLIVLLTASTMLFSGLTGLLIGLDRIPLFTTLTTTKAVITLILQILLLGILGLGLRGGLWELLASAVWGLCLALAVFIWKIGVDLRPQKGFIKEAVTYGGKIYPGHLGIILLSRVDIYFVALFGGFDAAGFYAVAKGLTESISIIETSISQGVMPRVIRGDFADAGLIVARSFRVSFWLSGLLLLAGVLTAPWLIPLIYGVEFSGVVPAFLLLTPGVLFLTTRILGNFFTLQIGRPEIPTYIVLASGLISLPISYLLTRQFGYLGAAAAFSIVAVARGIATIVLFVIFSSVRLKDVLLISKADLLLLPQMIPWRLRRLFFRETPIQRDN